MTYQEMDKRKFLLPDLLGKPLGFTDDDGNMIFPGGVKIPPKHFIFFFPTEEWKVIQETTGG